MLFIKFKLVAQPSQMFTSKISSYLIEETSTGDETRHSIAKSTLFAFKVSRLLKNTRCSQFEILFVVYVYVNS